jgi:serine/threonine protein kinase/ActR/RegA family two-component response regulator
VGNLRVLVAEDDEALRRMIAASLRSWGFDPVVAADGEEAWRLLSHPDAPKVAVLDWMMPGLDGTEVIRRVRERSPHGDTFILMLTARESREDLVAALKVGADDYLVKPFERAELEMRLRAGLRGRAAGRENDPGDSAMTGVGALVGGRYRVTCKLGEGGMGSVFEAEHIELRTQVAIKFMHPDLARDAKARARCATEARAASLVHCEHIARVHDYGVTSLGEPFIVMDRLYGETLGEALKRRGPLPVDEVVRIVRHVATGLTAAHGCGVLHRDIALANVFLAVPPPARGRTTRSTYTAKLVDFGVARVFHEGSPRQTEPDQLLGTLEYMSPERMKGMDADTRADLWALGACAYEAVTGISPFAGRAPGDTIYRVCMAPRPHASEWRRDLPPGFQAWFERACATEPNERFATATVLADALEAACRAPLLPRRDRAPVSLSAPARP